MKHRYTAKPILASTTDTSFEDWKRSIEDYFEDTEYETYLPRIESKWRNQYDQYLSYPESTKNKFPAVYPRLFLPAIDDDTRDYGPSNPWDAPGMSIRDFI